MNITDVTNGKLLDSGFLWRLHSGGPSKTGRSLHSFLSVLNSKPWLGPSAIKVTNCPALGDRDTILMVRGVSGCCVSSPSYLPEFWELCDKAVWPGAHQKNRNAKYVNLHWSIYFKISLQIIWFIMLCPLIEINWLFLLCSIFMCHYRGYSFQDAIALFCCWCFHGHTTSPHTWSP